MVDRMRSEICGTSALPRVATEIVWRARSIVTASRVGSSAKACATDRARHGALRSCVVSDSETALMVRSVILYHKSLGRTKRKLNEWPGLDAGQNSSAQEGNTSARGFETQWRCLKGP